jgi:hypothetical protein
MKMDPKKNKYRKLSAIVRDEKGVTDQVMNLILLAVLAIFAIMVISGAMTKATGSVEHAQKAGDTIIDHFKDQIMSTATATTSGSTPTT